MTDRWTAKATEIEKTIGFWSNSTKRIALLVATLREAFTAGRDDALIWTVDDQVVPEDEDILAAHPLRTGRHDLYAEAMRLVGAKRSKGGLVALVNWLLWERYKRARTSAPALSEVLYKETTIKGTFVCSSTFQGIDTGESDNPTMLVDLIPPAGLPNGGMPMMSPEVPEAGKGTWRITVEFTPENADHCRRWRRHGQGTDKYDCAVCGAVAGKPCVRTYP